MKFTQDFGRYFVIINNVKIPVPAGIIYVTIDINCNLEGWITHPYISDGYWKGHETCGLLLGSVELEEDDESGKFDIYEVQLY